MASQLARENTRFYVGRREINGPIEEVMHFTEYNRLFVTEEAFSRTDGFSDGVTANRVAAQFNNVEQFISDDLGIAKRFHYFSYKKDDQVVALQNYEYEEPEEEAPEEPEEAPTE